MDNFDYKKYLSNNPLTEAYNPGSGWTEDFEYDDMLAHGLTLTADTPLEDLQKVADDFEDVNYHREAAHLFDAIDAINDGNRGEAKMYINKFRKEIKTTLAGWDDVNEAESMTLTADQVEIIAQSIADEFTAEDSELDLKYVITPGSIEVGERGAGFDLDVEAGPNTPGAEWKDERGFSIANYLGDYAGGSFYIKDGKVFNAAHRNSFIANASDLLGIETPGEETDYMQRRKEMDDYAIDENKENKETKNTKMKKSELKEMIKAAMMDEKSVYEAEKVDVEDNEKVDVDIEKDVEVDDESVETDIDVKGSMPGEDSDEIAVQSLLMKAQEEAAKLGDEKLTDQIGNTITYFTRAHVATVDEAEMDQDSVIDVSVDNPAEDAVVGLDEMAAGGLEEKSAAKKLFAAFKKEGLKPNYIADARKLSKDGEAKDMVHIEPGEGSVEVSSSTMYANNNDKIAKAIKSAGFDVSKKEDNVGDYKLSVFTVDVKNVKEELNEEFKRFKKLAGIIK
jgi:hypothetical protein